MLPPVACYREFAPCEALRGHIQSFFSFAPNPLNRVDVHRRIFLETTFGEGDSFSSPLFADGNLSLVFNFDRICGVDGRWRGGATMSTVVIGAMSVVGAPRASERAEMLGVYFRAGQAGKFLRAPSAVLTDRIVAFEDLWGALGPSLALELSEADELARIDILERALLRQLSPEPRRTTTVDIVGLTRWVAAERGRLTVERMTDRRGRLASGARANISRRGRRDTEGLLHAYAFPGWSRVRGLRKRRRLGARGGGSRLRRPIAPDRGVPAIQQPHAAVAGVGTVVSPVHRARPQHTARTERSEHAEQRLVRLRRQPERQQNIPGHPPGSSSTCAIREMRLES